MLRKFCTSTECFKKVTPNNLKGKSVSSQHWLTRQLSDPYVEKAKLMNYRCRSAFKLVEIHERYRFLKPGDIVIDCGAAPGSWTQVAVQKVNSDASELNTPVGKVVSVDKQQIYPIEGATIIGNSDFTSPETQHRIQSALNEQKVNAVLSDMAPNATGIRSMDCENIINLCYSVLRFAIQVSQVGAAVLVKVWQCKEVEFLEKDLKRFYENVKHVKPNASRADSAELFLLGTNFKGLKDNK